MLEYTKKRSIPEELSLSPSLFAQFATRLKLDEFARTSFRGLLNRGFFTIGGSDSGDPLGCWIVQKHRGGKKKETKG